MRILLSLLLVLVEVNLTDPGYNRVPNMSRNSIRSELLTFCWNRFVSLETGLSYIDLALLMVCVLMACLVRRQNRMNRKLRKRILNIKQLCKEDDEIVGKLSSRLEDYRSRNTCLEMPLRKFQKQCQQLTSDVTKHIKDLKHMNDQFKDFRCRWQKHAAPFLQLSESSLLENMENLKVKAELFILKDFIERELRAVNGVCNYNKILIDEAEDDVDRLLISEGL